jgi:hypothetical protein
MKLRGQGVVTRLVTLTSRRFDSSAWPWREGESEERWVFDSTALTS